MGLGTAFSYKPGTKRGKMCFHRGFSAQFMTSMYLESSDMWTLCKVIMRRIMRKTAFFICEKKRLRSEVRDRAADQHFVFTT